MTAQPVEPPPSSRPFQEATPAEVRAALTPSDAAQFDRQWREAMNHARDHLNLSGVHEVLESWRRVAWLTASRGPRDYLRTMTDAEDRLRTGQRAAGAVPWPQLAEQLGLNE